jgi:C-terminal processing protease CtpA/Prc
MRNPIRILLALTVLALAGLACQALQPVNLLPTPVPTAQPPISAPKVVGAQPFEITGSFKLTNDFVISEYMYEHAAALVDMHAFVIRNKDWEIPTASQVLGYMRVDVPNKSGEYSIYLPEVPQGEFNDVDNNGKKDTGVQVFATAYWPNMAGGPFSEGDDRSRGWPGYLASVRTDSENQDEVTGGKLLIWSPDANEAFPTGFGADKLLFTADDPTAPVPAGYSIVDLDTTPFTVTQTPTSDFKLYEPTDVAEKDYSKLSMTAAFDKLVEVARKEYAFNGFPGKQPDWDKVYAAIQPRVAQAEKDQNEQAYYEAIRDFLFAFKDGHVSLQGDLLTADFRAHYLGGYGFTIRELDGGKVIVNAVVPGGQAEQAGIKLGAEVTAFKDQPIQSAISAVQPLFLNSSDFAIRYDQAVWLLRAAPGAEANVTFTNPGGASQTVKLTAEPETETLFEALGWNSSETVLPVETSILKQDGQSIGYIRILSNSDDLNLIIRIFEHALKQFKKAEVAGVMIDMRHNNGGSSLGLAGFLTDKELLQGQLEYYSDKTGKFEPEGEPGKIFPNQTQYSFNKLVLLVGKNCYSACELEAQGFSQVPGMIVVGETPTAGVEAETARGQFKLPGGLSVVIPTGRFLNPDGTLFLEGTGVAPTIKVPVNAENVLSHDDPVLQAAEKAVLGK